MEEKFKKVMSLRTNEELIKTVTIDRNDYNPIAIQVAELEIQKRNIDVNELQILKENIKIKDEENKNSDTFTVNSKIRFLNFLIDSIICILIIAILTSPLNPNDSVHTFLGYFILISTFITYYAVMESKFQRTIGKFITKTKVVKMNGEYPKTSEIVVRTICRFIPFDRISFLFTKNGFHDRISDTKVIHDNK